MTSQQKVHQDRYYSEKEGVYLGSVEFPFEAFSDKIWEMDLYLKDCEVVGSLYLAWYAEESYFFAYPQKDLQSEWFPFVKARQLYKKGKK